jgi:type IV secretory pathway TraG/TraD family ATPase VirD4
MLHPKRLGTARLLQPDEIEGRYPHREGGYWLGRSLIRGALDVYADGQEIGADDDRHFMLVGGTRGGKGQSVIVPNLCLWPGSVFCVDPKGENAMLTADARSEGRNGHPQKVYVLDPFKRATLQNENLRANFNPLWELMEPDPDAEALGSPGDQDYEPAMRPVEHAVDEAAIIASAIVVDEDSKEKTSHWNDNARRMISALILHVITNPRFRGKRNLITVRKLIMAGDEELLEICQSQDMNNFTAQQLLWQNVMDNDAFDGVIHEDGALFAGMAVNDPEQFSGVLSTAANHTDFLKSPQIRATLKHSDFRLEELKLDPRGISIYLCLPLRFIKNTHYRWLRMVIGLATQQMEKTELEDGAEGDCACGHKVLMVLDEFTSLRRMSYLEEALTQYGGAGLKMMFAVQTLDRLKTVYDPGWEAFISQCGIKYFFNADDNLSRKYISELVGETEVAIEQKGNSATATVTGGWTSTDTRTHATGGGASEAIGSADQTGANTNWNQSQGGNTNWTQGRGGNTNWSHGRSVNQSQAIGDNWSYTEGEGRSHTNGISQVAYKGLFAMIFGGGPSYEPKWTVSSSDTISQNRSKTEGGSITKTTGTGENWSNGGGDNWNHGQGGGDNWSNGKGGGDSISHTDNRTVTKQTSYQDSNAHAEGKSGSEANATGQSTTEVWHRRPIFLPEEVGRFFASSETKDYKTAIGVQDALYPGFALVLKGGGASMIVRRVNYYEDRRFEGLFNPHKKYKFTPLPPVPVPEPPKVEAEEPIVLPALPAPKEPRNIWQDIIIVISVLAIVVTLIAFGIIAITPWVKHTWEVFTAWAVQAWAAFLDFCGKVLQFLLGCAMLLGLGYLFFGRKKKA